MVVLVLVVAVGIVVLVIWWRYIHDELINHIITNIATTLVSMEFPFLIRKLSVNFFGTTTRYSVRNKQEGRKDAAVKLADVADTDSDDNKEEQNASVDNTCYMKLSSRFNLVYLITNHFFSRCNICTVLLHGTSNF